MKIYTEVIYHWDDDKGELVQESSKSYDYEGPLTLANGTEMVAPTVEYLQYPDNIGSEINNWVSFSAFDFKKQETTLDVALYIPGDALQTSYKADYESVNLGMLGAAGSKALEAINPPENSKDSPITRLKTLTAATMKNLGSESNKTVLALEAGFDKVAAGAKTIMEKSQGAVLNPYMTAAYKGPTEMRSHDFTFQMLPQSESESKNCVKIASAFKRAMLPSHSGGDRPTAPSMLFGYPDEFEINYVINGTLVPLSALNPLFRVGRSVLTGCDLDFATENVPLFFDNTQYPVSISMKLTFLELEVIYREKIDRGF